MNRLGGLVVITPEPRVGGPGSNPGPGEKFPLKWVLLHQCIISFDEEFKLYINIRKSVISRKQRLRHRTSQEKYGNTKTPRPYKL